MGSGLPNALTLPCRKEELQRQNKTLAGPAAIPWARGGSVAGG